ncbi:DinB family protein [Deinococcus apachensis]|uniref:DinB family protein n=1 Tax=Deinococcus apachensis TaxID=309886 RepID=UPI000371D744|nr:DinB family protein [Deinococcus apachensis]
MPYAALPDLTLEAFRRNGRVNAAVLEALTDADLDLSDGRGGWTVGQHLGHMAHFRLDWLSNISPAHAEGLPVTIARDGESFRLHLRDPAELSRAFAIGDDAALGAVQDAITSGQPFADPWNEGTYPSHPAHFLQHIVVHDSHHRGQVMALLRLGGRPKEELDGLEEHWAIWRA